MGAEAPRQGPADLCEGQQGGQCGWSGGLRGKAIRKMTKSRLEKSCGGKTKQGEGQRVAVHIRRSESWNKCRRDLADKWGRIGPSKGNIKYKCPEAERCLESG